MKIQVLALSTAIISLLLISLAASHALVPYRTSFSLDPFTATTAWTSTSPEHAFWESSTQTFRFKQDNHANQVGYVPVGFYGQSFSAEWDSKMNSCGYSAGSSVGFFDSSLIPAPSGGPGIIVDTSVVDCGHNLAVQYNTGNFTASVSSCDIGSPFRWEFGKWYTNKLEYNAHTKMIKLTVKDRDAQGQPVVLVLNLPVQGDLPEDANLFGASRIGAGYPGYSNDFNIDNVKIRSLQNSQLSR